MQFHLKEKDFKKFIGDMSKRINIDTDIIEKDYYVCTVLKEESNNSNKTRLKKSAFGYKISGLELDKDKTKCYSIL